MKQAAVDPSTGKIDISILTTGISVGARKARAERAQALRDHIKSKGKVPSLKIDKLRAEMREKINEVNLTLKIMDLSILNVMIKWSNNIDIFHPTVTWLWTVPLKVARDGAEDFCVIPHLTILITPQI